MTSSLPGDPDQVEATDPVAAGASTRNPRHTASRVFKNTAALGVGSNLNALGRLVVLAIIVRNCGTTTFGWYIVLVELLKITEWLIDFGTTEVFVRELSREPSKRERLLRILTATKVIHVPAGIAMLVVILMVMQYPPEVTRIGLLGVVALASYAAVVVYRVVYRVDLTMEREVGAEMASVILLIGLTAWVASSETALVTVFACFIVSRVVFAGLCVLLGSRDFRLSVSGVTVPDLRWALRSTVLIGLIGFLIFIYQSADLLVLSKLGSDLDLAYFSGAQKLAWPLLMMLGAIGTTMYSVVAMHWPHDTDSFNRACQRGFDTVFLIGALAVCPMVAAPEWFLDLLGPELVAGADALPVLVLLCLLKAVSMTVGSTLYIVHAQRVVFAFVGAALLVKLPLIILIAPRGGFMGIAYASLIVEVLFVTIPSLYFVWARTGFFPRWGTAFRVGAIGAIAVFGAQALLPEHGFLSACLAGVLYVGVVLMTRTFTFSELRSKAESKP